MIKKIVLWTLFAAFVGLIVFGAINRTNAKLEDQSPEERQSSQSQGEDGNRGQSGKEANESTTDHEGELLENLPTPSSTEETAITIASAESLEAFVGDSAHEWVTLTGSVVSVTTKTLTLTLNDGQTLLIERRPWRFAQENGFTTAPGNQLEIIGFYEDGLFQAAQIHDLTADLLVRLRDETGHPLWASE